MKKIIDLEKEIKNILEIATQDLKLKTYAGEKRQPKLIVGQIPVEKFEELVPCISLKTTSGKNTLEEKRLKLRVAIAIFNEVSEEGYIELYEVIETICESVIEKGVVLEYFEILPEYAKVSGVEINQRKALIDAIAEKEQECGNFSEAYSYVVEEVAYTWFNRLIAIRFMEVNDFIPSGVRVISSESAAKVEPDLVTNPFDTDLEFSSEETELIYQLKDQNRLDELFRILFIKQCNSLHQILPDLFEKTDDYTELLLTLSFTDIEGVIYHLTHDIDESDFNIKQDGHQRQQLGHSCPNPL